MWRVEKKIHAMMNYNGHELRHNASSHFSRPAMTMTAIAIFIQDSM